MTSPTYWAFFGLTCGVTVLATVIVALRLATTRLHRVCDLIGFFILAALFFSWAFLVCVIIQVAGGRAGDPERVYSIHDYYAFLKLVLTGFIVSFESTACSKISILLTYRRIFPVASMRTASNIMIGLVSVWVLTGTVGAGVFYGEAFHSANHIFGEKLGRQTRLFSVAMIAINVGLDVAILCLPQHQVRKLQMARRDKLKVSLVFLLGGVVCIFGIVRAVMFGIVNVSDFTASEVKNDYWSMLEMNFSIICACIPTTAGLIRRKRRTSPPPPFPLPPQEGSPHARDATPPRRKAPDPISLLLREEDAHPGSIAVLERPSATHAREKGWRDSFLGRMLHLGSGPQSPVTERSPTVHEHGGLLSRRERDVAEANGWLPMQETAVWAEAGNIRASRRLEAFEEVSLSTERSSVPARETQPEPEP